MRAQSIALVAALLVLSDVNFAHGQSSMACDAKKLCSNSSSCVTGGSLIGDHRPGEVPGLMSWHSDVFRRDIPGAIATQSYCYYRVVRIDNPAALPLFWRAAGLKYLGSKAGTEKGCVFACTDSKWDEKGPPKSPIKGDIEYQTNGLSRYAESWGPESGWSSNERGDLGPVPGVADPGSDTKTLVAQEQGDVRVELETQALSDGRIRYSVRNVGRTAVRIVWNVAKNEALSKVEGPFTRSGMDLGPGDERNYEIPVVQGGNDARIIRWQTQVAVRVAGGPSILVAVPALGPSNGSFTSNPVEFWQEAGAPR